MNETQKILVVDDESQITWVLRRTLSAHRYQVRTAADGESALETFHDFHPDLVITDLSMPEVSGLDLCRELRKISQVPIIVLSVKGDEKIKVEALDAGADDYVTKPFGMDELLARVRASLRRVPNDKKEETLLEVGDFSVNLATYQVFVRGEEIHLTPKEFELLTYLVKNHGRVLTHRTLLGAIWGGNFTEQTEYLRVFLRHLRKKIESNPSKPKYILTEPWVGYRFNPFLINLYELLINLLPHLNFPGRILFLVSEEKNMTNHFVNSANNTLPKTFINKKEIPEATTGQSGTSARASVCSAELLFSPAPYFSLFFNIFTVKLRTASGCSRLFCRYGLSARIVSTKLKK